MGERLPDLPSIADRTTGDALQVLQRGAPCSRHLFLKQKACLPGLCGIKALRKCQGAPLPGILSSFPGT